MLEHAAWDAFFWTLLVIGIAGGIFYCVGRMHEKEVLEVKGAKVYHAAKPPAMYKCCDHCFHPVTGEHYGPADSDIIHFRPDTHSVPCSEEGCVKGRMLTNV